mmetsp:Transcript_6600/g.26811  ORF Transcript_6600/g.26811 Transcript_6600/m.26811 type:complete len:283 (-) Transcript_6600:858-1706(-)
MFAMPWMPSQNPGSVRAAIGVLGDGGGGDDGGGAATAEAEAEAEAVATSLPAFADAVAPAGEDASASKIASANALTLSSANLAESLAEDVPRIRNAGWWDVWITSRAGTRLCHAFHTSIWAPPNGFPMSVLPTFHRNTGGFLPVARRTCACRARTNAAYRFPASSMYLSAFGLPYLAVNAFLMSTLLSQKVGNISTWSSSSARALRLSTKTKSSSAPETPETRIFSYAYFSVSRTSQCAIAQIPSCMQDDLSLKMGLPSFFVLRLCTFKHRLVFGPHSENGG